MIQHNVNPSMIILAREYRGLTQNDLAKKIDITPGFLCKIEKGIAVPTEEILDNLGKILKFPPSFFERKGSTYHPNLYYRKKSRTSAKVLTRAEAEMNIHRFSVQELLNSVDLATDELPVMDLEEFDSPSHVAKSIKQIWRVPKGPIKNIFELVERHGIIIISCDFGTSDIDGRNMFTDNKVPLIFLNHNSPMDRQRFNVAHELGHLLMHVNCSVPDERDIEKEANQFASEFLLPEDEIKKEINGPLSFEHLADLKRYWKVSMQAILYKAKEERLISQTNYKRIMIYLSKNGMRKKEPVVLEPPKESPQLLPAILKMHLNDLELSEDELASVLKLEIEEMKEKYFDEEKSKLKIVF